MDARTKEKPLSRKEIVKRVLLILLALIVLDVVFVVWSLRANLASAAERFVRAEKALENGELGVFEDELLAAQGDLSDASSTSKHPAFLALSFTPDAKSTKALIEAAELSSNAGLVAVDAADALGIGDEGIATKIYDDGRVNLSAIEEARPDLVRAEELLRDAGAAVEAAPGPFLSSIQGPVDDAQEKLEQTVSNVDKGLTALDLLPSFLAQGESRRYLLAFQALGEARATGGLVGLYGVLDVQDGKINLEHIGPIEELRQNFPYSPPVESPEDWYADAYRPQFALRQSQQTNITPNFKVAAEVFLRQYEAHHPNDLDGAIAMDPVAFSKLLRGTGTITDDDSGIEISEDNAAEILLKQSYLRFPDPEVQNRFLASVINEFWNRLESGEVEGGGLVSGFVDAASTGHIQVYSRDSEDQAMLETLGADGPLPGTRDNIQMVYNNSFGNNKVDYFLDRRIDTRIHLNATGDARVEVVATLENQAPDGPKSLLLGPNGTEAGPPGRNEMVLNFLLPRGARVESFTSDVGPDPAQPFVFEDSMRPVTWDEVTMLPGDRHEITVTYFLDHFVDERTGRFDIELVPQPRVFPDRASMVVSAPEGYSLSAPGSTETSSTLEWSAPLTRPKVIEGTLIED